MPEAGQGQVKPRPSDARDAAQRSAEPVDFRA